MLFLKLSIVLSTAVSCGLDHSGVFEKDGRIFFTESSGRTVPLTTSGRDSEPFITNDSKLVSFCRRDPVDQFRTTVYAVDLQSRVERLLLAGPVMIRGLQISYFGSPQVDKERNILYALAKHSVTTGTLFAIDLQTRVIREVAEASSYVLIRSGEYKGDLLVSQRHETLFGEPFYFYVYWLYSPNGKDLGIAAPDSLDVRSLMCPTNGAKPDLTAEHQALPHEKPQLPAQISSDIMTSRLRVRIEPEYPVQAAEQRTQGIVRLLVFVSADGGVSDVKLISGHPSLVSAAVEAVRKWKYEPTISNGHAVPVSTVVEVSFPRK